MKIIKVSTPGKFHLLGEHTVVHGKPALLTAINKRVFVSVFSSEKREIKGAGEFREKIEELCEILESTIKSTKNLKKIPSYAIDIDSQFPVGAGFGSSAALSASITGALLQFLKIPWDKKEIFEIAYEGEKFFHGNPSGGDLAVVIQGGLLWFRKEFEFLKTFNKLTFKIHKNMENFYIVDSGKPEESTKEMIEKVTKLLKGRSKMIKEMFNYQEELTKRLVKALKDGNEKELMVCIKKGQKNLESFGVVGKKAKELVRKIEKAGGVAKISGAGGYKDGSGVVMAYFKDKKKFVSFTEQHRLNLEKIILGEEGLRIEK